MKTLLTIFLTLVVLTSGMAQTVRRVNNNTGISGTNVYSTFALAHAAAVANDIIILEPSNTSYGSVTITKPLKIYGNGYWLATNTELKADRKSSSLTTIEFNTGSDGSEVYGIEIGTVWIYGVSNLRIERNYLSSGIGISSANKAGSTTYDISNLYFSRNYIQGISISGVSKTVSNVFITNNIISGLSSGSDPNLIQSWIVRNNTFFNNCNCISVSLQTGIFENNLFTNTFLSSNTALGTGVTYSYNIFLHSGTNSNGNIYSYDLLGNEDLQTAGTGISTDELYKIIKPGSILKTAASDGGEVGAFGGTTPYIVSGIPAIPSITSFINTATGDANTPVKVTISVKSNN